MDGFQGSYQFVKDDGKFDAFLQAIGVNFVTRAAANNLKPTVEIKKNDDGTYSISTKSMLKNSEIKFKLGEEFEEERMDGKKVKTTVTVDGNKLTQKSVGEPDTEFVREFDGDKMIVTCKCKDVTCVREYVKQ